jgi:hypothetical protein
MNKEQVLALRMQCHFTASEYVQKQAAMLQEQALPSVQARVQALGHTVEAFNNVFSSIFKTMQPSEFT